MTRTRIFALLAALLLLLPPAAHAQEREPLQVLLIGVDARNAAERGRSDTMMLARVDAEASTVRLVSFLRDLYVPIPGYGSNRLNAAYAYGGEALLRRTLTEQFGVRVDRTVTLDFSLLRELVDQLGGVEVELQPRELPALNAMIREFNADYGLSGGALSEAGVQLLDGRQALCYSRLRKLDSDFQRVSRQQAVIQGMLKRLSQLSKWELARLALRNLRRVETDLTLADLAPLASMLGSFDTLSLETARVPGNNAFQDETIHGMQVLVPDLPLCRKQLTRFLEGE